jgi:nucleotide-binding universal stress UspA family protein
VFRRILVPLDGSRFGDHALAPAIDIAVRLGATIELVHVHRYAERDGHASAMPQYQYQHVTEADARFDADVLDRERQALEEKAADLELRFGVAVQTRILTGRTPYAIATEAGNIAADLVVLASHGRTGLDRIINGSLAHTLLAQLNVPTLCVHPASEDADLAARALRRLLVALDGSPFSEQILDIVAPLATRLEAEVTLLHVVSPRPLLASGTDDTYRTIVNRDQAVGYLHDLAERWRGRLPEPLLLALEDRRPANLVSNLVAMGEYDAVAMATHGRGGLSALLMGSVANDVLRATATPVLLYRPREVRLPESMSDRSAEVAGE